MSIVDSITKAVQSVEKSLGDLVVIGNIKTPIGHVYENGVKTPLYSEVQVSFVWDELNYNDRNESNVRNTDSKIFVFGDVEVNTQSEFHHNDSLYSVILAKQIRTGAIMQGCELVLRS